MNFVIEILTEILITPIIEIFYTSAMIHFSNKRVKLNKVLGGIEEMRKLPNAIFVVDPKVEHNAVKEARKLKIPVFGIVDTNCDPDDVDYIIPANDDAIRAVKLIAGCMADAVIEAKQGESFDEGEEAGSAEAAEAEVAVEVAEEKADEE